MDLYDAYTKPFRIFLTPCSWLCISPVTWNKSKSVFTPIDNSKRLHRIVFQTVTAFSLLKTISIICSTFVNVRSPGRTIGEKLTTLFVAQIFLFAALIYFPRMLTSYDRSFVCKLIQTWIAKPNNHAKQEIGNRSLAAIKYLSHLWLMISWSAPILFAVSTFQPCLPPLLGSFFRNCKSLSYFKFSILILFEILHSLYMGFNVCSIVFYINFQGIYIIGSKLKELCKEITPSTLGKYKEVQILVNLLNDYSGSLIMPAIAAGVISVNSMSFFLLIKIGRQIPLLLLLFIAAMPLPMIVFQACGFRAAGMMYRESVLLVARMRVVHASKRRYSRGNSAFRKRIRACLLTLSPVKVMLGSGNFIEILTSLVFLELSMSATVNLLVTFRFLQ